jgi:hypothetical protein
MDGGDFGPNTVVHSMTHHSVRLSPSFNSLCQLSKLLSSQPVLPRRYPRRALHSQRRRRDCWSEHAENRRADRMGSGKNGNGASDSVVYLRPKYLFITSEVLTMLQLVYTALASHRLSELSASAIFVQAAIVMHDLCDQQLSLAVLQLPPYIHLSNVNMSLTDQRCCA